jgi:hypothetical protein
VNGSFRLGSAVILRRVTFVIANLLKDERSTVSGITVVVGGDEVELVIGALTLRVVDAIILVVVVVEVDVDVVVVVVVVDVLKVVEVSIDELVESSTDEIILGIVELLSIV